LSSFSFREAKSADFKGSPHELTRKSTVNEDEDEDDEDSELLVDCVARKRF
jgi:hypothetical protein